MSRTVPAAPTFLPNLVAAALCAIVTIAYAGSFGGLVFGGPLDPFVGRAVIAALVSSIVVLPLLAWRSSFSFSLGGPDSNPAAILAFTMAAVTGDLLTGARATPAQLVPTALMLLFLSSTACGLVLYATGRLGWGRYVRYIPHPVVGGFLAGSGYLLVAGAWKMLTARPLSLLRLGEIAHVPLLAWGTALLVALALLVVTRLCRHFLVIPLLLLGAMGSSMRRSGRKASIWGRPGRRACCWRRCRRGTGRMPGTFPTARCGGTCCCCTPRISGR